ncbi:MAG TPA: chemotaxis protein CheW [Myxococcales bacterium]|nr:chemotaxis protein CheW [Myxococcales bacterium]
MSGSAAAALRAAFDRSFAEAPAPAGPATEDLLAISIEGQPYALRLSELAGLFADRRVSPLPSPVPELLGLAGLRGRLLPVYDLRRMLGHSPTRDCRWLVVAAAAPVALAFDELEGHVRLAREAIAAAPAAHPEHLPEIAMRPTPRPVLRLASVLAAIQRKTQTLT